MVAVVGAGGSGEMSNNRKSINYVKHKQKMSRGKYLARNVEKKKKREQYLFAVLVLWLPIILCSQFLADGGQSHITGAVIPAAILHNKHRGEREHSCSARTHTHTLVAARGRHFEAIRVPDVWGGQGGKKGSLTAPQMETQSSRVLRKLLGSKRCQ